MNRINTDAFIRLLIILGFIAFFAIILGNGSIQLYVHPRVVPYVKFGIGALIVMGLCIMQDLFKPNRRKSGQLSYLFFIVPLFTAFVFPAKPMDSNSFLARDANISQRSVKLRQYIKESIASDSVADRISAAKTVNTKEKGPRKKPILNGDTIIIDERNYVAWMDELYDYLNEYEGKRIQTTGFVFRNDDLKESEFVTARYMMSCCTADAQVTGLLSVFNKAGEYKKDTWVKVTGKVAGINHAGKVIPGIMVESVERVPKPENEYIYVD